MADIHISDFYKDVANIFSRLHACFPRKTILYVEDISGPDEPDDFGLHSQRFIAGFSAMVWLGDQGYLRYDAPIRQEALDQAVLTEQGFLMLSSRSQSIDPEIASATPDNTTEESQEDFPPSIIAHTQSNIIQLRKALKSGSSIKIQQCVQEMLNHSFCQRK